MPDLHPGKGCPIGTAFVSKEVFYPFAIGTRPPLHVYTVPSVYTQPHGTRMTGGDIGCGMSLVTTDIAVSRASAKRRAK